MRRNFSAECDVGRRRKYLVVLDEPIIMMVDKDRVPDLEVYAQIAERPIKRPFKTP